MGLESEVFFVCSRISKTLEREAEFSFLSSMWYSRSTTRVFADSPRFNFDWVTSARCEESIPHIGCCDTCVCPEISSLKKANKLVLKHALITLLPYYGNRLL